MMTISRKFILVVLLTVTFSALLIRSSLSSSSSSYSGVAPILPAQSSPSSSSSSLSFSAPRSTRETDSILPKFNSNAKESLLSYLALKQKHESCPVFSSSNMSSSRSSPSDIAGCPEEELMIERWAALLHKKKSDGAAPRKRTAGAEQAAAKAVVNVKKKKTWLLVNIGINKGYALVSLLRGLGVHNFSKTALGAAAFQHAMENANGIDPKNRLMLCGGCCECAVENEEQTATLTPRQLRERVMYKKRHSVAASDIEIYGYDGSEVHVNFVRKFLLQRGLVPQKVHLRVAAVSDVGGGRGKTVPFPNRTFGDEFGAIGAGSGASATSGAAEVDNRSDKGVPPQQQELLQVPLVTLDEEIPDEKFVDVLLSDTEGHDFLVARGASKMLQAGRVGILILEVHQDRPPRPSLRELIEALDAWRYRCFFPAWASQRSLIPISGKCWREEYDAIRGWHNVVCTNRRVYELEVVVEQMLRRPRAPWHGGCSTRFVNDHFLNQQPPHVKRWAAAAWRLPIQRHGQKYAFDDRRRGLFPKKVIRKKAEIRAFIKEKHLRQQSMLQNQSAELEARNLNETTDHD